MALPRAEGGSRGCALGISSSTLKNITTAGRDEHTERDRDAVATSKHLAGLPRSGHKEGSAYRTVHCSFNGLNR